MLNCDNVYCGQITRRLSNYYYFILVAQLTISHCAGGGGGVISARARPRLTLSVGILLFCPPSALASPGTTSQATPATASHCQEEIIWPVQCRVRQDSEGK